MDPMSILFPVLSVGGMGVVFGACLGVASEVFKVEEDPQYRSGFGMSARR